MQLTAAVTRVKNSLGFRPDLDQAIRDAILEAQEELENGLLGTLPWFLRKVYRVDIIAPESSFVLPNDFLRELETEALYLDGGTKQTQKVDFIPDCPLLGSVWQYYIDPTHLHLDRSPDETVSAQLRYYAQDATILSNVFTGENKWLRNVPLLLIGLAGHKVAVSVRDRNAVTIFQNFITQGQSMLERQNTARGEAGRVRAMGGVDGASVDIIYSDTDIGR